MLQPAIRRRLDHLAAYDVMVPITQVATGPWLMMLMVQPYWNNATPSSCASYRALAARDLRVGYPRAMRWGTLYSGLTETAGVWNAITTYGNMSGRYSKYTASTGGQVTYAKPAGHDRVALCHYVVTGANCPTVRMKIGGVLLGDTAYGSPTYPKVDTVEWTVPAAAANFTAELVSGGSRTFYPISVTSWKSDELADPRAATAGVHDGNFLVEKVVDSRAAVSTGNMFHSFSQGTDWWRLWKPNTLEPILQHNPGAGLGGTGLGFHYVAPDYPFTVAAGAGEPTLWVDGVLIGNMNDATIARGALYQGDAITIRQYGTAGAGTAVFHYEHCITGDGISMQLAVVWGGAETLGWVYGPCLSGAADAWMPFAAITHRCRVPNTDAVYSTGGGAVDVGGSTIDVDIDGCPFTTRITSLGADAHLHFDAGTYKVYSKHDAANFPTPAAGVVLKLAGHLSARPKDSHVILPAGVGVRGVAP